MELAMNKKGVATSKQKPKEWKIIDKPGEFAMIPKDQLQVDTSYQRSVSTNKGLKIAQEWSWVAFGTLSVALRGYVDDNGKEYVEWYVLDGQHRLWAAKQIPNIKDIPCMVFDIDSVAEEARAFLTSNSNRRTPFALDRFKALLSMEDHTARVTHELILSSGRTVAAASGGGSKNTKYFTAIRQLMHCVEQDEKLIRHIWPVVVAVSRDKFLSQALIGAMFCLEQNMPEGVSLVDLRWRKRLLQVGYDELVASINRSAVYHGSGSPGHWARGLIKALNKGLVHKLVIDALKD